MSNGKTLRSLPELVAAGLISASDAAGLGAVASQHAIAVPPLIAREIKRRGLQSALARQYLPQLGEALRLPLDNDDPIGDERHSPVTGLVHRYPDRVLLKLVHACPVYCRFCFRREMVGPGGKALHGGELDAALAYLAAHPEINEVILTGGDPLIASPRRLSDLLARLGEIDHLQLVRLHSRVPVTVPDKITDALVETLAQSPLPVWLAVHVNHPDELFAEAREALGKLAHAGIPLLSQTVLLRGVNDDAGTLRSLFTRLGRLRVRPYYLHHPDRAPGTAHFRLGIAAGLETYEALKGNLSGWLLPRYVLDIPGGVVKIALDSRAVTDLGNGHWRLEAPDGQICLYSDDLGEITVAETA